MSCVYCNHYILYKLKDGSLKCARCKKKISIKKIERKAKILKGFLDELTPNEVSKKYNISYATVVKEFKNIREEIVRICEEEFLKKKDIKGFEEYSYIPANKNFLTINFDDKIYNVILGDLRDEVSFQKRLIKVDMSQRIEEFWDYFENFIKKFKGVSEENFFYYLKEVEFRFNNYKLDIKDLF